MSERESAVPARPGGRTYHLVPEAVWSAQTEAGTYRPESLATEGFIHCTDGEENLLAVANRYYRDDDRPYVALMIDLGRVVAPVRYEDAARIYPHVYGPLNRDAVVDVRRTLRAEDGSFVGIE